MDSHRLCPIHSEYNKVEDLKILGCLYKTLPLQSHYLSYQRTVIFKVNFHRLCPSHSEYNQAMDLKILGCLYQTLPRQSLYLGYQSTIIFNVDFHRLCPIHSEYNKVVDLKILGCLKIVTNAKPLFKCLCLCFVLFICGTLWKFHTILTYIYKVMGWRRLPCHDNCNSWSKAPLFKLSSPPLHTKKN